MGIKEIGEQNQAVPGWIRLCLLLPLMGLAAYFIFGYHGIFKWLAELQIYLFDGYLVFITGMLTLILTLLPALPIMVFLRKKYAVDAEMKVESTSFAEKVSQLQGHFPRLYQFVLFSGLIAVITLVFGIYLSISSSSYGSKTKIELSSLKRGGNPLSKYVSLEGELIAYESKGMIEQNIGGSGKISTVYTPVSNGRSDKFGGYYCFVKYSEKALEKPAFSGGDVELHGTLSKNSLPGMIREQFKGQLADTYWVLDYGHKPSTESEFAWFMFVISLISGVCFVVLLSSVRKKLNAFKMK